MFFSLVVFVGFISAIAADEVTPPPPMHGNFGGTKKDRNELVQKLLSEVTSEQRVIFTDTSQILYEGMKAFNGSISTQVRTYAIFKASIASERPHCDSMAHRQAEELVRKARDDTIACFGPFRTRVLKEGQGLSNIRELPIETLEAVVIPLDDCFQNLNVATVEKFGYATLDYAICTKKP